MAFNGGLMGSNRKKTCSKPPTSSNPHLSVLESKIWCIYIISNDIYIYIAKDIDMSKNPTQIAMYIYKHIYIYTILI